MVEQQLVSREDRATTELERMQVLVELLLESAERFPSARIRQLIEKLQEEMRWHGT